MSKLELPVIVTPSRIELGLRCKRRHAIGDLLQYSRYRAPSLHFGTVIHSGAGAWWLTGSQAKALGIVQADWAQRFTGPTVDLSLELAMAMTEYYVLNAELAGPFSQEDGEWQIVSVEDRLEIPLGPDAKLSFQTDRVLWNQTTKHLVVVDTKTAGRFDKKWIRQWETSLQMKLYKAAASAVYGFDPRIIDVVIEGVLKDIPCKIQYVTCPEWSPAVLGEAVEQAKHIANGDKQGILLGTKEEQEEWAVNHTEVNYQDCYSYGVECQFRRLCTAEPEQRAALLHSEYTKIPEDEKGY